MFTCRLYSKCYFLYGGSRRTKKLDITEKKKNLRHCEMKENSVKNKEANGKE